MIFSDETKTSRFNSYGRSWCWIGDREHVGPQHVHQTVKHGGGSVMIWGCMTALVQEHETNLRVGWIGICTSLY